MVDIDLGEMFLNFPLPILLRRFSRIDLHYYVSDMGKIMAQEAEKGKHLVLMMKSGMKLRRLEDNYKAMVVQTIDITD
jgi:hypothetical protein